MIIRIIFTCHLLLVAVNAISPKAVVPTSLPKDESDDLNLSKDASKNFNDMLSITKSTLTSSSANVFLKDMKAFSKQLNPAQLKQALGSLSTQLDNQMGGPALLIKSFMSNATASLTSKSQFQSLVGKYQASLKMLQPQKAKPTKNPSETAANLLPEKSRKSYEEISNAVKSKTFSSNNANTVFENTVKFFKQVSPAQFNQAIDPLSTQLSGTSGSPASLVKSFFKNVTSGQPNAAQIQHTADEYQTTLKKTQPKNPVFSSNQIKQMITPAIRDMFDGIFQATPRKLSNQISDTLTSITDLANDTSNDINGVFDDFTNNGSTSDKATGISKTFSEGLGDLGNVVGNLFPNSTNTTKSAVKTVTDVASGVGSAVSDVSNVLKNKNATTAQKAVSIADSIGSAFSSLFGHIGKKTPKKSTKKPVSDTSTSKPLSDKSPKESNGKLVSDTSTSKPLGDKSPKESNGKVVSDTSTSKPLGDESPKESNGKVVSDTSTSKPAKKSFLDGLKNFFG